MQNLPASFQWLGLSQSGFLATAALLVVVVQLVLSWSARKVAAFRSVYATGSDVQAARLAGIDTRLVKFAVMTAGGAFTGAAALLNVA